MISLLKPSSGSHSADSTNTHTMKDAHRGSMASRMGIGVDTRAPQSPSLPAQGVEPRMSGSPQPDDHSQSGGILIHHDRTPSFGQHTAIAPAQDSHSDTPGLPSDAVFASPSALGTATLPISPALSSNAQSINNAHEKIPADQLPPTVRPGVPVRAASKIRFAPLPNPRRQRSLSTGRNIAITATMEPNGTRTLQKHARMDREDGEYFASPNNGSSRYLDEEAVEDDDLEDDDDDDDGDEGKGKRSSWKTMGMGNWKTGSFSSGSYTRKLLKPLLSPPNIGGGSHQGTDSTLERATSRESGKRLSPDIAMPTSQSLRKTFSTTSGFIGSSPFRTAGEHERKRTFFPGSSGTAQSATTSTGATAMDLLGMGDKKAKQAQRASNTPDFSSLSASLGRQADTDFAPKGGEGATSPRPVKMLNGRVYGKNRQAEPSGKGAAEPEFVEWGGLMGQRGGGIGTVSSAAPTTKSTSAGASLGSIGKSADDDDDGSGMGWVKRRREQRDRERRASEMALPDDQSSPAFHSNVQPHHVGSLPISSDLQRHWQRENGAAAHAIDHMPAVNEDRVATPIHTEHFSLDSQIPPYGPGIDAHNWNQQDLSQRGRLQALDLKHEHDDPGHIVQAIQIPGNSDEAVRWRQSFEEDEVNGHGTGGPKAVSLEASLGNEEEEDDEEEENDFESDDEEELAIEEERQRSTCSAAGVEVVSRHRD